MDSLVSNDGRGLKHGSGAVFGAVPRDSLVSNDGRGLKHAGLAQEGL